MYKVHDEKMDKGKIRLINFISFLMSFLEALFFYIISTYFKEASGTENIGPFYLVTYGIILIILLNLHKAVRFLGKSNIFYFSLLFRIISLVLLLIYPFSLWSVIFLMLYIIFGTIEWVSMDVILESFSIDNMSGRIRGKHLTILNTGFLLGPLVSTQIIGRFGYNGIFMILLLMNSFLFIVALLGLRSVNHRFEYRLSLRALIKKVAKKKNVQRIYWISFALEFFYALAVVYTPIYLLDLGMSWERIGWIFTFMLVPFVILQYPAGLLADKRMGEKEMILLSLIIIAISSSAIYIIAPITIFAWSLILFSSRVGASILEILRDSYFYKRIDGHDVDLIDFFKTAQPVAYILSAIIAFFIFKIFPSDPIKIIFVAITLVVILAIYPAWKLVDNKCEKELAKS